MYSFFDYLPHAQDGMQQVYVPRIEDFPDYNSYRAAMDQYTAMNGYDEYPQEYDTTSQQGYGHMRWHPEWNDEEMTPQQAQMVAQAQTVQAQQPVTPTSAPIPTRPGYTGPSIVDYLGMNGKASDYNTRKLIAESMGIKNYRGTAAQNTKILKQLLDNPNGIDGYNYTVNPGNAGGGNNVTGGGGGNSGGNNGGGNNGGGTPKVDSTGSGPIVVPPIFRDSIMNADHNNTGLIQPKVTKADGTSGTTKMLALTAAAVAAGGITAYEAINLRNLIKSGAFKNSAQFEEKLANAKFSLQNKTMDNVVGTAKDFQKWWKGLPNKQKGILNNLDANEIAGFNSELRAGSGLKDLEAYNMLKEAEAEGQILGSEAKGLGTEAKGTGAMLKEAYMAAKNTPWLMKTLNAAKKLRFDDGGSTFSGNAWYQDGGNYDDTNTMNSSGSYGYGYEMGGYIPDYQMAYGGAADYAEDDYSMMAKGGEMIRRADGSYSRRGLWDNIRANKGSGKKPTKQMLAQEKKINARSMENGGTNNPGFHALPEFVQHQILSNMAYGGIHINPANEGKFTTSAQRAGMGVQEFASHVLANREDYSPMQVKRANFAHNAASWKHANGGQARIGQELEVTPEQAEMLRQQGYQFEIL